MKPSRLFAPRVRIFTLFLLVAILSTLSSGQVSFLEPLTFQATGATVYADFNRDGKLDVVSSFSPPQGTQLFVGNGDGTFKAPINLGVSGNLIATADFNNDGKPDLLVADPSSTVLNVLLGNGDGTFQPPKTSDLGISFVQIIVADVNGDGKPDVLGLAFPGTQVFVVLGNGDGTFKAGVPYSAGPQPTSMVIGDFNGDGNLDIATVNAETVMEIAVLLGNGNGTFQSPVISTTSAPPTSGLVASEVNGDSKLDLIGSSGDQTYTFLGNGNGTFQAGIVAAPAGGNLGVADLNGDGKPDLVIGGLGTNPSSEIWLGNGDGTFTYGSAYATPAGAGNVLIADFSNSGKFDLAIGGTMLLGNGDGTFKGQPVVLSSAFAAAVGDFNGDGNQDLAVLIPWDNLEILLGNGKGTLTTGNTYPLGGGMLANGSTLAASDLNGDGKLDLAILTLNLNNNDWGLTIMLGNGDGTFGAPTVYQQGLSSLNYPPPPVIADLRGDGKPYVLTVQGDSLVVFPNNGDGTFGAPVSYFAGSQANDGVVADFTNDGKLDAAVSSAAGLGILLGNGDGTFQTATFTPIGSGGICCLSTGDFNNDGKADLIISNQVFLGKGDGTFTSVPGTLAGGVIGIADFNGDGVLDVLEIKGTGGYYQWDVQLGNGDGTFGSPVEVMINYLSNAPAFAVIADFNGDNKPDIGIGLAPTGLFILLNTTTPGNLGLRATGSSSVTVAAESTANYTLSIGGAGISGHTSLTCTGAPTGADCSISPASLTVSATTPSSLKVSVTTTSRTMAALIRSRSTPAPWLWAVAVMGIVVLPGAGIRGRSLRKYLRLVPLGLLLLLCSCGGGSSSATSNQQTNPNGTPAGNYTLTVTAKSGSMTQSMGLTLTVQ